MSTVRMMHSDKETVRPLDLAGLSAIEQQARALRGAYLRELMRSAFRAIASVPRAIARHPTRIHLPQFASLSK